MMKILTIGVVLIVLVLQNEAASVYKTQMNNHFLDEVSPDLTKDVLAEQFGPGNRDKRSYSSYEKYYRPRHPKCNYHFHSTEELTSCNNYWGHVDSHGTPPTYYIRPFYGMPHPGGQAGAGPHHPPPPPPPHYPPPPFSPYGYPAQPPQQVAPATHTTGTTTAHRTLSDNKV